MDTKTMEKDNPTTHSFFGVVLCGRLLELPTCQFLNLCWIQLIPLHLQKSKHSNVNFNYYGNIVYLFSVRSRASTLAPLHQLLLRTLRHGYSMSLHAAGTPKQASHKLDSS
jgi:hypothetical protein